MKKVITENIGLKVLSFLIGFILWAYVIITENPEVVRDVRVELQKTNFDQSDYELGAKLPDIRIRYRAPRKMVLDGEIEKNISAQINFLGLSEERNYDLRVSANVPAGVQIVSFTPSSVKVQLLKKITKTFSVNPRPVLENQDLEIERIVAVPSSVTIKGLKESISRVSEVIVIFEILKPGEFTQNHQIILMTENKNRISDGITIDPSFVQVMHKIRNKPEKTVRIRPVLSGELPANFLLKEVTLDPDTASVKASGSILDKITELSSETIDLSTVTKSLITRKPLISPGADVQYRPKEVTVTLKIVQKTIRRKVTFVCFTNDPVLSFSPSKTVEVEVEGTEIRLPDLITIEVKSDTSVSALIKKAVSDAGCETVSQNPQEISVYREEPQ